MRVVRSRYHHSHNIEAHASRPAADGAEEAETSRALTRSRQTAMSSRGHCHGLSFAFCRLLVRTLKWDLLLLFDFLKRTPLAVLASRRGFDLQMCFCCKLSKRLHPSRELKSAKYIFHDMILNIWQMFCKIGLTVFYNMTLNVLFCKICSMYSFLCYDLSSPLLWSLLFIVIVVFRREPKLFQLHTLCYIYFCYTFMYNIYISSLQNSEYTMSLEMLDLKYKIVQWDIWDI